MELKGRSEDACIAESLRTSIVNKCSIAPSGLAALVDQSRGGALSFASRLPLATFCRAFGAH